MPSTLPKSNTSNRRTSFFTQLVSGSEDEPKTSTGKSGSDSQHIYIRSLNDEIRRLTETTVVKEKIKAIKSVGHLMYSGGGVLESHIRKENRVIKLILDVLQKEDEIYLLRLVNEFFCVSTSDLTAGQQALQTLTVLCRCGKIVQDAIGILGGFEILRSIMIHEAGEYRQWATHGLLCLCLRQNSRFEDRLLDKAFRESLQMASEEDWSNWATNEAAEFETLIDLMK